MVSSHLKMWLQGREIARQKQKLLGLLWLLHTFGSTRAPQMRSYPLCGFLLEIRKVANTMTNNPRILRHTAMGATLLFLSAKHSSSERKRRSDNVIAEPHTPKLYICMPEELANTSQKFSKLCILLVLFCFVFPFSWAILTTLFICGEPYLKKTILAPSAVALCFPREWLFSLISAGIVSPLSTHTAGAFFPKADGEHHNTKSQSENKKQDTSCMVKTCSWHLIASSQWRGSGQRQKPMVQHIISTVGTLVKSVFSKKNQILIVLSV